MTTRVDTITAAPPSERLKFENTPGPSVLRIKLRKRGWVPISRALIDDARLQFDTRGVASWLIAKPDGWQIRLGALPYLLQQRAGPGERIGRDRVRRMLRELENAGYLTRARSKKPDGRWAWRVELCDTAVPFYRSSTIDGSAVDGQGVDLLNTLNNSRLDKLIPTTTTEPKATENAVVVQLMEVQYPDILKGGYLTCTRKLIEACPPEQRQPVLDEIGAIHAWGKVRSPLGLLKSLVEKAKSGEFSPNYSISASRSSSSKLRSPVHARQPLADTPTASKAPVPVFEIAPRLLADWREKCYPTRQTKTRVYCLADQRPHACRLRWNAMRIAAEGPWRSAMMPFGRRRRGRGGQIDRGRHSLDLSRNAGRRFGPRCVSPFD